MPQAVIHGAFGAGEHGPESVVQSLREESETASSQDQRNVEEDRGHESQRALRFMHSAAREEDLQSPLPALSAHASRSDNSEFATSAMGPFEELVRPSIHCPFYPRSPSIGSIQLQSLGVEPSTRNQSPTHPLAGSQNLEANIIGNSRNPTDDTMLDPERLESHPNTSDFMEGPGQPGQHGVPRTPLEPVDGVTQGQMGSSEEYEARATPPLPFPSPSIIATPSNNSIRLGPSSASPMSALSVTPLSEELEDIFTAQTTAPTLSNVFGLIAPPIHDQPEGDADSPDQNDFSGSDREDGGPEQQGALKEGDRLENGTISNQTGTRELRSSIPSSSPRLLATPPGDSDSPDQDDSHRSVGSPSWDDFRTNDGILKSQDREDSEPENGIASDEIGSLEVRSLEVTLLPRVVTPNNDELGEPEITPAHFSPVPSHLTPSTIDGATRQLEGKPSTPEQLELQSKSQSSQPTRSPEQSRSRSESLSHRRQFETDYMEGIQTVGSSSDTEGGAQRGTERPQDPYTRPNEPSGPPSSRIPRRSTQPLQVPALSLHRASHGREFAYPQDCAELSTQLNRCSNGRLSTGAPSHIGRSSEELFAIEQRRLAGVNLTSRNRTPVSSSHGCFLPLTSALPTCLGSPEIRLGVESPYLSSNTLNQRRKGATEARVEPASNPKPVSNHTPSFRRMMIALPFVLETITMHETASDPSTWRDAEISLIALSQVARGFRATALSYPLYWGYILNPDCQSLPWITRILHRSKDSQLRLTFSKPTSSKPATGLGRLKSLVIQALIIRNLHRCCSIRVGRLTCWILDVEPTTSLQSISIDLRVPNQPERSPYLHRLSPHLHRLFHSSGAFTARSLRLYAHTVAIPATSSAHLTSLEVVEPLVNRFTPGVAERVGLPTARDWMSTISLFPNLEYLHLSRCIDPKQSRLWIRSSREVSYRHMPNLRTVILEGDPEVYTFILGHILHSDRVVEVQLHYSFEEEKDPQDLEIATTLLQAFRDIPDNADYCLWNLILTQDYYSLIAHAESGQRFAITFEPHGQRFPREWSDRGMATKYLTGFVEFLKIAGEGRDRRLGCGKQLCISWPRETNQAFLGLLERAAPFFSSFAQLHTLSLWPEVTVDVLSDALILLQQNLCPPLFPLLQAVAVPLDPGHHAQVDLLHRYAQWRSDRGHPLSTYLFASPWEQTPDRLQVVNPAAYPNAWSNKKLLEIPGLSVLRASCNSDPS
ncbi:hypothetical protein FA13DRAFT_1712900 [Coprinellus micaceus]|uniref:Uncharacterized protein n=1 Tax=Coprinellus micaceus TaxID=71717 RepID=A0A4Y7SYX4_COPMI|nr:hypothetical protein FA13DRAFT_1712900 [Coprinellus micaceus]